MVSRCISPHAADRLGAERRDRLVDDALDERQRVVRRPDHRLGPTRTFASETSAARCPSCVG